MFLITTLALGGLLAGIGLANPLTAAPAQAVTGADFKAGEIISDIVMYNEDTMSVSQIQAFLNNKGGVCKSGYTCIKSYKMTTTTKAADPMCGKYTGAKNESAATIIYKAAQACGVNPQVLLVTLQKEQGLITATSPTSGIYRKAMGFGCPDTSVCNSQFYGFFNQVYKAAWAYQRYTTPKGTEKGSAWCKANNCTNYNWYPVGKTTAIKLHPSSGAAGLQGGELPGGTPSDGVGVVPPTATPKPEPTPEATPTPEPTATAEPTATPDPTITLEPIEDSEGMTEEPTEPHADEPVEPHADGTIPVEEPQSGSDPLAATSCGYKSVTIKNRATAALYYYTPYTPNKASLNAWTGLGDACSSYGNRNFFRTFNAWFGSSVIPETHSAFAHAAFVDILDREPGPAWITDQAIALTKGKLTRKGLIAKLLTSTEYRKGVIRQAYRDVLGREPESSGLAAWLSRVQKGTVALDTVYPRFYQGNEFYNVQGGGTNKGFAAALYKAVLRRAPDASGLAYWTSKVHSLGRPKLAALFWTGAEHGRLRTVDLHRAYFDRGASLAAQKDGAAQITSKGFYDYATRLLTSSEYINRANSRYIP